MLDDRKAQFLSSLFGVLYAVMYTLQAGPADASKPLARGQIEGLALIFLMPLGIRLLQRLTAHLMVQRAALPQAHARFLNFAPFSYLAFFAGYWMVPTLAATCALWVLAGAIQGLMFLAVLRADERDRLVATDKFIALLFLVSGFSALIYQVVWQRVLFSTFGINSESVTVVVSVFMFGLGLGSLAGGWLQQRLAGRLLELFLALEVAIGVYGVFSLDLIAAVSHAAGSTSTASLVFWVYLILAIPTLLMGATLPILVAWLQGYLHNIGRSVGLLYAFNTIGSAIAAFATVQVLFVFTGLHNTVLVAACCNFATAALIYGASRTIGRLGRQAPPASTDSVPAAPGQLSFGFMFVVLLAIGYIALSQEILWYRVLGFMTANKPQVFGLLLAAYLAGVASGSLKSKALCESNEDLHAYVVRALACAAAVFYFALPITAQVTAHLNKDFGALVGYALIGIVAYFSGGILPMLIHLGIADKGQASTRAMSLLYFANIIGATAGPLLTGFILLDRYTLEQNITLLSLATLVLLVLLVYKVPTTLRYKKLALFQLALLSAVAWLAHGLLFDRHLEKLQYAVSNPPPFKHVLENKSGIITVEAGVADIMYGNGIYDGRFNIDPLLNVNQIDRTFMIAALHRKPERVLDIGLSTGSWARIVSDYLPLKELVVVEINPGYRQMIENYPDIASMFTHEKLQLNVDDGRRWLRQHPDEKFDFILMNTSYHWRANMTNLLSAEFLILCKQHLKEGGVMYYNTTGSRDVIRTAAAVFKHVVTYSNFVAASDAPFDMTPEERRANLLQFVDSKGEAVLDRDARTRQMLATLSAMKLNEVGDSVRTDARLWTISDDNMATEYKTVR
ncbi:methyltransferase domain-containing protein [Massilia sp. TS11]|uniref:spermine/spermidine synthase domain-containing protein n=1 Tax=Massilia sp. TS11 TaxID=2908003 RepID=UPI001EDB1D60|nr:methyltransferase domain-containing protein [Massilia sp. TS11]MCG2583180.1 methyltransferase domain-containing protein [Massilia sp. TS11]